MGRIWLSAGESPPSYGRRPGIRRSFRASGRCYTRRPLFVPEDPLSMPDPSGKRTPEERVDARKRTEARKPAPAPAPESDAGRVPPGQVLTKKWPVLHHGDVPRADLAKWEFRVF